LRLPYGIHRSTAGSTDFGKSRFLEEIPEALRLSPETKEHLANELVRESTILKSDMRLKRPLKLRGQGANSGAS
jgi:hypothetical protein